MNYYSFWMYTGFAGFIFCNKLDISSLFLFYTYWYFWRSFRQLVCFYNYFANICFFISYLIAFYFSSSFNINSSLTDISLSYRLFC